MVEFISLWAKNIAIAVIISTLIMMILPDSKNKKYIKVIIGIYILFCVISPVASKSLNFNEYNIENYISTKNETNQNMNYSTAVNEEFKKKMIENIKKELNDIGFKSEKVSIQFDDDYNITELEISDVKKYKTINKIEINTKNNNEKVSDSDVEKIKKDMCQKYSVNYNLIIVNK